MSAYYIYILRSNKERHYIGFTSNLEQRLAQHNRKHSGFTATSEKWELVISRELPDKQAAMELEKLLKSFKNPKRAINYLISYQVQSTSPKATKPALSGRGIGPPKAGKFELVRLRRIH